MQCCQVAKPGLRGPVVAHSLPPFAASEPLLDPRTALHHAIPLSVASD
jgi:hypothetical protein